MHKTQRVLFAGLCGLGLLTGCHMQRDTAAIPVGALVPATSIELHAPRAGLYTSGQPAAGDWQAIAARGVTTVVNLRTAEEMQGRDEAAEVRAAGMRYVSIPVAGAAGLTDQAADALAVALHAAPGPVLVHCHSGNRAGGLLAITAVRDERMPVEDALALGRAAGMTSTEARVRDVIQAPDTRCVANATGSGQPEHCP
jgi:uncharacterized protein (TIGR01244 family)